MGYKIVYVKREDTLLPLQISPNTYQINCNDLVGQINSIKNEADIQYLVFEDKSLLKHTNFKYLEDQKCPILFKFKNIDEFVEGISLDLNNPLWAMCSSTACKEHFDEFLLLHSLIKKEFNHEVYKSVNFSFESSLTAIEFATSVLDKFSRILFPDISNLDFFQYNLILRELLTNAVKHGNNSDINKHILLTIYANKKDNSLGYAVKDQGEGFNFNERLKTIKNDELRINQRGLFLIKEFCTNIFSESNIIIAELKK